MLMGECSLEQPSTFRQEAHTYDPTVFARQVGSSGTGSTPPSRAPQQDGTSCSARSLSHPSLPSSPLLPHVSSPPVEPLSMTPQINCSY